MHFVGSGTAHVYLSLDPKTSAIIVDTTNKHLNIRNCKIIYYFLPKFCHIPNVTRGLAEVVTVYVDVQ